MNQYSIHQKIKTISDLCILDEKGVPLPIIIDGIEFKQWDFNLADGCKGDAWIAEGKEEAKNYHEAFFAFRKKLSNIVPKIAFVSQCYMDYTQETFLVNKINDNSEKIAFIHYVFERGVTGLMFMEEEGDDFEKLKGENNEFFWYMTDCYNTTGYTAKLLLIFSALESLAGKEVKKDADGNDYETYNKDKMKEIIGDKLYNTVYGKGGMRHKLTHGEYIDPSFSGTNYVDLFHKLILEHFNKNFGTKLNLDVVHPQRHPFGNAYYTNVFIKPKEGYERELTLKKVTEDFKDGDAVGNQTLTHYEFIHGSHLDNY